MRTRVQVGGQKEDAALYSLVLPAMSWLGGSLLRANLLGGEQLCIGVIKLDCDAAGRQ